MGCFRDVLKKTSPLDVFGDVSEKVKHLTKDAFYDVSPPALARLHSDVLVPYNLALDLFFSATFHNTTGNCAMYMSFIMVEVPID